MTERIARRMVIVGLVALTALVSVLYFAGAVGAQDDGLLPVIDPILAQACAQFDAPLVDMATVETSQELADDNTLTLAQVASGAWKADVDSTVVCNPDADVSAPVGFAPTVYVFDAANVLKFQAWLAGAQPVDWDALWLEYQTWWRTRIVPRQEGDYCRAHDIPVIDISDYSTVDQLADESGYPTDGIFVWANITDTPIENVCNMNFEAELRANRETGYGSSPTVPVMDPQYVGDFLMLLQDVRDGKVIPLQKIDAAGDGDDNG